LDASRSPLEALSDFFILYGGLYGLNQIEEEHEPMNEYVKKI